MKRTYIKPFMESEEFVTNEYVAACWLVTCITGNESMIVTEEPNFFESPDKDGFALSVVVGEWLPVQSYYGEIEGKPGETKEIGKDNYFHRINYEHKGDGNGPNAS